MNSLKFVFTYGLIILLTIFALYLIKIFNISYPLTINTTSKTSELAVVGEGKIDVVPDTGSVEAGITVNNAPSVSGAQKTLNEINNKIIDSMKNLGIKKEDIKTTNFSINPNYVYENGQNRIDGYNGNAQVSIKVRNIDTATRVMEKVTESGANQVFISQFYVENPEKYREEARNLAIQNAKDQASKLAKTLGINLGKVVNIVESQPQAPVFSQKTLMAPEGRGGGASIEPGSQTLTSTVTLYFEKK